MGLLRNVNTGTRLALAFGLMLVLLVLISALGIRGSGRVFSELKTLYEDRTVPLKQLGDIDGLMLRNRILVMEMLREPARLPELDAQLQTNIGKVSEIWKSYLATYLTDEEQRLAATFTEVRTRYVKEGLLATRDAVRNGDVAAAQAMYGERITPLGSQAKAAIDALLDLQVRVGAESYSEAEATSASVRLWCLTATGLAVLLALLAAWMTTRSITEPMKEAVTFAEAVAEGDLRERSASSGADEAARLVAALAAMTDSLRGIVTRVRGSSESIATGSSQIATGSLDLSQRTEEQASSLQETAASMEQLTSTVHNNAATAGQANTLASEAARAADSGGTVVSDLVRTMDDISASSRKIADIIGVIDSIAFQTNILALNAAVEAARAGEQGRGFAVVASEVRALAQRSAQAAREIKTLITHSADQVASGSQRAGDAGQAMQGIVGQVRQVSVLIEEIASASQEQSRGIQQIGLAVTQLDQVTQQNAALVEESSAAADSLQQQAAELADLVRVFKLA